MFNRYHLGCCGEFPYREGGRYWEYPGGTRGCGGKVVGAFTEVVAG